MERAVLTDEILESHSGVRQLIGGHFRCPEDMLADFTLSGRVSDESGYFCLGPDVICYGQYAGGVPAKEVSPRLPDVSDKVRIESLSVQLPFDPTQIIDNLRRERYAAGSAGPIRSMGGNGPVRKLYYRFRPFLPVALRKHLQKLYLRGWETIAFPAWPIDRTVDKLFEQLLIFAMRSSGIERVPFVWYWPEGAKSAATVTHDVETAAGVQFSSQLMDLNDSFGIKASFQVVPEERYPVPDAYLDEIRTRGFELNVQDLNHDGLLYSDRAEFLRRAERIDEYRRQWKTLGFRSAILYRNADWYDALNFEYDTSIPNVAHLDPQRGGCCTLLPFFIGKTVELPVTMIQDYSLFHILNDYSTRLWKNQISRIHQNHGLASLIVHPDYIIEEVPRRTYTEFLSHLSELRDRERVWIALPGEIADWWRLRNDMTLVRCGDSWKIRGEGSERATLAYASLEGDKLRYDVSPSKSYPE